MAVNRIIYLYPVLGKFFCVVWVLFIKKKPQTQTNFGTNIFDNDA